MSKKESIEILYNKFLRNEISKEELEQFLALLDTEQGTLSVSNLMDGTWVKMFENESVKIVPLWRRSWLRMAAAVIILLSLSGGIFYLFDKKEVSLSVVSKKSIQAPETNRATITMADGTVVYLDSAGNGQLATQGNIRLVKLAEGKIAYELIDNSIENTAIANNTVSNPKASKAINISLSDGSKVWLNAGSSITYPVLFTGTERKVSLQGEGYFEVTKVNLPNGGPVQKFMVEAGSTTTEVLGTRFNINAYNDDNDVKVTLLEGSVALSSGSSKVNIKPGQQAKAQGGGISINNHVNMDEVMAWRENKFYFENTGIKEIMNQLSRWYNIEVLYFGNVNQRFDGSISKDVEILKVLDMLEYTGGVKFKIEGRKVIVLP